MRFDSTERRERMVERQVAARGIRNASVLRAMRAVPRDEFVPKALAEFAYDDTPLPIASDQTISQPYIVALMADTLELEPGDKVLEIGTGSGYAAAVLARIAAEAFTIERHESLCASARARFAALGVENVQVRCGDGTKGWPEEAPFDAIAVTAGGPAVPQSLREQLAIGGRLVIPVGDAGVQRLMRIWRTGANDFEEGELAREVFGDGCYAIGFGTDHGTVAAASDWGAPLEIMQVRPSHAGSYERIGHDTRLPGFLLPLRPRAAGTARTALLGERLERAIGVIYRPESELASNYFHASLPRQFDEWIWLDETTAVDALPVREDPEKTPETFPFGL